MAMAILVIVILVPCERQSSPQKQNVMSASSITWFSTILKPIVKHEKVTQLLFPIVALSWHETNASSSLCCIDTNKQSENDCYKREMMMMMMWKDQSDPLSYQQNLFSMVSSLLKKSQTPKCEWRLSGTKMVLNLYQRQILTCTVQQRYEIPIPCTNMSDCNDAFTMKTPHQCSSKIDCGKHFFSAIQSNPSRRE